MSCLTDIWLIVGFIIVSLVIGIVGIRFLCKEGWYDSLCLAPMTLSGNYYPKKGQYGALFCSFYGLYGTLIVFIIAAFFVESIFHQVRKDDHHKH